MKNIWKQFKIQDSVVSICPFMLFNRYWNSKIIFYPDIRSLYFFFLCCATLPYLARLSSIPLKNKIRAKFQFPDSFCSFQVWTKGHNTYQKKYGIRLKKEISFSRNIGFSFFIVTILLFIFPNTKLSVLEMLHAISVSILCTIAGIIVYTERLNKYYHTTHNLLHVSLT